MIYRVVETKDGRYKSQCRVLLLFWMDSVYSPSLDKQDQIDFCKSAMASDPDLRTKRIIWP